MGRRNKHHYNNNSHNQPRQQTYQNGNHAIDDRVTSFGQEDDAGASHEESHLLVTKEEGSTRDHIEKDPTLGKINHETSTLVDTPKKIPLGEDIQVPKATLFNLIRAQLSLTDTPAAFAKNTGQKHERIYNFLHVPQRLEKFLFVGYMVCLDSFLYNLTILPVRIIMSIASLLLHLISFKRIPSLVKPWRLDFIQALMIGTVCFLLTLLDSSRLYHSIRGQSVLKLYVIYNLFEIFDKLCCSFGLDILDAFFARFSMASNSSPLEDSKVDGECGDSALRLRPLPHLILSICYIFIHSVVLFYQVITLNVSINSFSNALLTLLVSNQFVEIKSALTLYIVIIGGRNLLEIGWGIDSEHLINHLLYPLALVYLSEILVDWLKHAFITKFNHIHPEVYGRFVDILCKDMVSSSFSASADPNKLIDQSSVVSRRIGFSVFPLTCLTLRVFIQILWSVYSMTSSKSRIWYSLIGGFIAMFAVKLFIGAWLTLYCLHNQAREQEEKHQRTRTSQPHIKYLVQSSEDKLSADRHSKNGQTFYHSQGSMAQPQAGKPSGSFSLETIDRFTLFKSRIP